MYAQLTFNVVDDIGTFHLPELAAAPYYELLRSYLADAMSDQAFCAARAAPARTSVPRSHRLPHRRPRRHPSQQCAGLCR